MWSPDVLTEDGAPCQLTPSDEGGRDPVHHAYHFERGLFLKSWKMVKEQDSYVYYQVFHKVGSAEFMMKKLYKWMVILDGDHWNQRHDCLHYTRQDRGSVSIAKPS